MPSSLKTKLAFSHLGVIICTVSILAAITYWMGLRIHNQFTFDNLQRNNQINAIAIQDFIANKENVLKIISESREAERYSEAFNEIALAAYFKHFKDEFVSLSYISPLGIEEVRINNGIVSGFTRDLSTSAQFKEAIEKPGEIILHVVHPDLLFPSTTMIFTLAKKRYFDDQILHVIQAVLPVATLEQYLNNFTKGSQDDLIAIDSKNTILIHPLPEMLFNKIPDLPRKQGMGEHELLGIKGAYRSLKISSPPWTLVSVIPYNLYIEGPIKYAKIVFAVVVCVLLASLLVVTYIARKINAPLTDLTDAARQIACGKKIENLLPYQIEELDKLAEAFNTMSVELTKSTISKDYLNNIVNSLKECLLVTDHNGTIESANTKTFELLGYKEEQLIGLNIGVLLPKGFDTEAPLADHSNQEAFETSFTTFDNKQIPIVFYRSIIRTKDGDEQGIVCLAQDIRKRLKIEEEKEHLKNQLYKAQRLETVGTLASGIAHDFNNILTIILGYSQILMFTTKDEESKESLQQILGASNRAKDLVQQLLNFSRQGSHTKMELSVSPIIKEIVKMLKSSSPSFIEISAQVDQNCSSIIADPNQIQQIIMNLCSNAIQAMDDYGILSLNLEELQIEDQNLNEYQGVPRGKYNLIVISDTGHGIKEEDLDHIFDPFFTTKSVDKGTGLGLAVVHGMIQNMQGHIFVTSKEKVGTTFTLLIPSLDNTATGEAQPLVADLNASLKSGGEHILFVDDERALAQLGKRSLEGLGYRVTSSTSSLEALELFRNSPNAYDLLITDFSMPKMQGDKLIKEFRQIRRDFPVILCTGYHAELVEVEKIEGIYGVIKKPYATGQLAHEVKEVLGKG